MNLVLSKFSNSSSLQELSEKVDQLKRLSEEYKTRVETLARENPLETTSIGLVFALIIGIIIGVYS